MKASTNTGHANARPPARVMMLPLLVACCFLIHCPSMAALVIHLPGIQLLPNTAGQSFDVHLQNSGGPVEVTGMAFNIQVADGGPAAGGSIHGPAITSVNIFTGTVFGPNNNGLSGGGSLVPQVYERGTLTAAGTVSLPSGESRVATVTLDTTGFGSGTFGLTLDTLNGPAKYTTAGTDLFPALIEGSVTIAPPPVITGLAIHNPSRMALTFSSTRGFGYRIQRAQAVADALWTNVPHSLAANDPLTSAALPGSGTTQTLYVEVPVGAGVFYRVSMERSGT